MKSLEKISEKRFEVMNKQMLNSFKGGQDEGGTWWICTEPTSGGGDSLTTITYDGRWSFLDGSCTWENLS